MNILTNITTWTREAPWREAYQVQGVNHVEVSKDINALADTAEFQLPAMYRNRNSGVEELLKVSDPVLIRLGYSANDNENDIFRERELRKEFFGFISEIEIDRENAVISCVDGMYLFRSTHLETYTFSLNPLINGEAPSDVGGAGFDPATAPPIPDPTLRNIMGHIVTRVQADHPGVRINLNVHKTILNATCDQFIINSDQSAEKTILDLQEKFPFWFYIRTREYPVVGGQLEFDLMITPRFVQDDILTGEIAERIRDDRVAYDYRYNIKESDLTYVSVDNRKVVVDLINMKENNEPDHTFVEYTTGTDDPQVRVINTTENVDEARARSELKTKNPNFIKLRFYDLEDRDTRVLVATELLKDRSYNGVDGSITTWLDPYITIGSEAIVNDPDYPERSGIYFVAEVNTTASPRGGNRMVYLTQRIA